MKNYLKPISMTFMATVLCVSTASAGPLDFLNPKKAKEKIGKVFNPGKQQQPKQTSTRQPVENVEPQRASKIYDNAIPAHASINSAVYAALTMNRSQIGNTAIDTDNVNAFYQKNGAKAVWTNQYGLTDKGAALWDLLTISAPFHGLETKYYLTSDVKYPLEHLLEEILMDKDWAKLADIEILLTQGYMLFAKDVSTGRINPKDPSQGLQDIELKKNAAPTIDKLVANTRSTDSLFSGVLGEAPQTIGYNSLVSALARITEGVKTKPWLPLDTNIAMKIDRKSGRPSYSNHANAIGLRQRLVDFGYLPFEERDNYNQIYDETLEAAIKRFQTNNFLVSDGIAGRGVYSIMAQPVEVRINQIKANLEKWRLYPKNLRGQFIMVDMGRQELDVIDNNELMLRMKVVVGAELTGTPTMKDQIPSFVLAPYWTSPNSIVVKETIPKMYSSGKSPAQYLRDQSVQILSGKTVLADEQINAIDWKKYTMQQPPPYSFRQMRGEGNALGFLKFNLISNKHSIYLHDTNAKQKFNEIVRYYSHGCIRVEKPFVLAAHLKDPSFARFVSDQYKEENQNYRNEEERLKIEAQRLNIVEDALLTPSYLLEKEAEQIALTQQGLDPVSQKIKTPMDVYIFGTTTVTYPEGADGKGISIGFGPDIYKQDERIIKALDQMANPTSALKAIEGVK